MVESNRPKTIISVTDKDSPVCVSSKPTIVVFFSHLSTGPYLIVEYVSIVYVWVMFNFVCEGMITPKASLAD